MMQSSSINWSTDMTTDTGEPAFPLAYESDGLLRVYGGMTLRDYFAAKAIQGICASKQNKLFQDIETLARGAYVIADAMLEARDNP